MEEDLFRKMMSRWGVRPGKNRGQEPEPEEAPPARPAKPQPARSVAVREPERESEDDAFARAMDTIGVRRLGQGLDPESRREFVPTPSATPEDDRRMFLEALDEMESALPKDAEEERQNEGLRRVRSLKERQIGATLDLHGYTQDEALRLLAGFVAAQFAASAPVVMVITGKGLHSRGGTSVLKPAVEKWIKERGKRFIARYGEAPRAFGGRGAFVLYLREK